eukprot:GILI01004599.1.p1 GENE.GILI01004599.1~~GILI01004599.1.p1  ORF type:complete len:771 (+),score=193.17 GILI01004599.1:175-2487(+)
MSFAELSLSHSSSLPRLPGYSTPDSMRSDYKRRSHFDYKGNTPVCKDDSNSRTNLGPRALLSPSPTTGQLWNSTSRDEEEFVTMSRNSSLPSLRSPTRASMNKSESRYTPSFVQLANKVLRFYGYFLEPVHDSAFENFRVRKLVIMYYIEDGSIQISEPRVENVGFNQGPFLKRQKVPKDGGEFLGLYDFVVGQDVHIYGRIIRLVDCDKYTRDYYDEETNFSQPESMPYPEDAFAAKLQASKTSPKQSSDIRNFVEISLGGGRPKDITQFLSHDREVLRFFAHWEDPDVSMGGHKNYEINYFLSDDTAEIRQVIGAKQEGVIQEKPRLLSRAPLPKSVPSGQPGQISVGECYRPEDFRIGGTIYVFGREFVIDSCDKFTEDYYYKVYGVDFSSELHKPAPAASPKKKPVPPPYTGYGTEEDSLGSVLYLVPKQPKKDFHKLIDNMGKSLRFACTLVSGVPGRHFILTWYLEDDSMMIYEPHVRNGGVVTGKFLERNRYKNPDRLNENGEPQYFSLEDFYVGALIKINHFTFRITNADVYTVRNVAAIKEGKPIAYSVSEQEITKIEQKLRRAFASSRRNITEVFRRMDLNKDSLISFDEFKLAVSKCGFTLSDAEVLAIFSFYDENHSGLISWSEFVTRVNPQPHEEQNYTHSASYTLEDAAKMEQEMSHKKEILNDVAEFVNIILSSNTNTGDYWRALAAPKHSLSRTEFADALKRKKLIYGHMNDSLCEYLFPAGREILTGADFMYDVGRARDIKSLEASRVTGVRE